MLSADDTRLFWQIEVHCRRCMRAVKYCDAVSGTKSNLWAFTQNCYGEIAITYWCKVFGANSEPTHFSKLFESRTFVTRAGCTISIEDVRQRLRSAVAMAEDQYHRFWKEVKDCRDKVFVHDEFTDQNRPTFPDLTQLSAICGEMRTIIGEIVASEECQDSGYLANFRQFMEWHSNRAFLQQVTVECNTLAAAVGKT